MERDARLRPEAQVLPWSELTDDQADAAKKVHELFLDIASSASTTPRSPKPELELFLPRIDQSRSNHVALLDGGRGSGKTIVLLRLLSDWSAAVRREEPPEGSPFQAPHSHIVPVGLLDLEPLPTSTNLLVHLAGTLQRVVEAMDKRSPCRPDDVPWSPGESDERASRLRWRMFLKAAAAGWDGNLERRKAALDPEAYAIELEQAERQRLDVVSSFRAFVDALVDEYRAWRPLREKPLFVISIDDADMNPGRVVEVFELLRTLWHPRVAFLVAGDSDLFVTVLRQHYRNALESPMLRAPGTFGGGRVSVNFGPERPSEQLAADVYRKVIPPRARFKLSLSGEQRHRVLQEALRAIPTAGQLPSSEPGLSAYLALDEQARGALPERMRELIDLRHEILHGRSDESSAAARLALVLWEAALARSTLLDWQIAALQRVVRIDEVSGRLTIASSMLRWSSHQDELGSNDLPGGRTLVLLGAAHFSVSYNRSSNDVILLPERLAGVLKLAINIAVNEESLPTWSPRFVLATSVPTAARVESAGTSQDKFLRLNWPLPEWDLFLDHELFAREWGKALNTLDTGVTSGGVGGSARHISDLLWTFLDLVRAIAKDRSVAAGDRELPFDTAQLDWPQLAADIVGLLRATIPSPRRAQQARRWALSRAGLLAAPEYGLPAEVANAWLDALRIAFNEKWPEARQELCNERRNRVARAMGGPEATSANLPRATDILLRIDDAFQDHAWAVVVEGRQKVKESSHSMDVSYFVTLLNTVPVATPKTVPQGPWLQLGNYFWGARAQAVLSMDATKLERVKKEIEQTSNVVGSAQQILLTIWEIATEGAQDPTVKDLLRWDKARGTLNLNALGDAPIRPTRKGPLPLDAAPDGSSRVISSLKIEWRPEVAIRLSAAQQAILKAAWDIRADEGDLHPKERLEQKVGSWWPAAEHFTEGGINRIPWPAPDWPALLDWEILTDAWNQVTEKARSLSRSGDSVQAMRIFDSLAYWFMRMVMQLGERRGISETLRLNVENDRWRDLGRDLANPAKTPEGIRSSSYEAWRKRGVLMAAPETGLSAQAVEPFLSGYLEAVHTSSPGVSKQHAMAFRGYRVARLVSTGLDQKAAVDIVNEIDAANRKHPWIRHIGMPTKRTKDH
jgi:hypothetical protein